MVGYFNYYDRMFRRSQILIVVTFLLMPLMAQQRIEADFIQTRTMTALAEPIVQKGHFLYIYPDSVNWTYEGLDAIQMPPQMASLIHLTAISDTAALRTVFRIEQEGNRLTLYPIKKQLSRIFRSMTIRLGNHGAAEQVVMIEPTGDQTTIDFNHIKVK